MRGIISRIVKVGPGGSKKCVRKKSQVEWTEGEVEVLPEVSVLRRWNGECWRRDKVT